MNAMPPPRRLTPIEIGAITRSWFDPIAAEILVCGGTALAVLRAMAVNCELAIRDIARAMVARGGAL
jgi:hypothetical protein